MEQVIFLGDIHREVKTTLYNIERKQITDSVIIQVGDFGIGYASLDYDVKTLEYLNNKLKESNNTMYVIRGNHDDKEFFKGEYSLSNLYLLPDYTQMNILGRNFLFIGGAVSIDRKRNIAKYIEKLEYGSEHARKSYWENEVIELDIEKLESIRDVDVLVTHTAPSWCFPMHTDILPTSVEDAIMEDPALRLDLTHERATMDLIFNTLKRNDNPLSLHVYGHFHQSAITEHWSCKHHLLAINELKML